MGAVGGALIGAALLLLSTFDPPAYAFVRGLFSEVTTPIASALDWARRGVAGTPAGIAEHFNVLGENARLKKQLADNETLVGRARTLNQENHRLRAMLNLRDVIPDAVVAARLVNSSASSTRRYATLNAGWRQGVKAGQPVREPNGLIGQIIEAGRTARACC
ncbi:MAG: rod shape-determining protein MreC [Sphingomonas sp.]